MSLTFPRYLCDNLKTDVVDAVLRPAIDSDEFKKGFTEAHLSELSQYFLGRCRKEEVPVVLRALTKAYQHWVLHLLDEIDSRLTEAHEINQMVLHKDLEWLLPGRIEFWHQLRSTLSVLREDIDDFRES